MKLSARQLLRIGLGVTWLLDGALQLQPAMFTDRFAEHVLKPAMAAHVPAMRFLATPIIHLWLWSPVFTNSAAALLQLALGAVLLVGRNPKTVRLTVIASIFWALAIWVFGEGFGGIGLPHPSYLTGAPGAALLYAIGGALLLRPSRLWRSGVVTRQVGYAVGALWLLGAALQLQPAFFTARQAVWLTKSLPSAQPQPVTWLTRGLFAILRSQPAMTNGLLIALMVIIGVGLFFGIRQTWLKITTLFCLFLCWTAMDFGVFGGLGTDPGMPPLLLLLCLIAWTPKLSFKDVPLGYNARATHLSPNLWRTHG